MSEMLKLSRNSSLTEPKIPTGPGTYIFEITEQVGHRFPFIVG